MIYLKAGEQLVLILEPSNIEKLKNGEPLRTPDRAILIAYCPDIVWLAEKITTIVDDERKLDVAAFDVLLQEGLDRPTIYRDDESLKKIF